MFRAFNTTFELSNIDLQKRALHVPLFRMLGEFGVLGIIVPIEYGGSGMNATNAVIAPEELHLQIHHSA